MSLFSLFPSTIITLGATKACVFDIERSLFAHIPKSMGLIIQKNRAFDVDKFISQHHEEEKEVIQEYISFLIENNLGMLHDSKNIVFKHFDIPTIFESPFPFETMIIDAISEADLLYFLSFLPKNQIVNYLQLRLFFKPTLEFLENLASNILYIRVELVLQYSQDIPTERYSQFIHNYSTIFSRLIIMGVPLDTSLFSFSKKVILIKEQLQNSSQCGIINKSLFMPNIESFFLSCSGNSCLYKKIAIDIFGNIKNCPSMDCSYGHITNTKIVDLLQEKDFKKFWYIKKDDIEVCKDCEFRFICTDCRAFIVDSKNIFSKPLKCTYNPYSCSEIE